MAELSRRAILQAVGGGLASLSVASPRADAQTPVEKYVVGVVGMGGMGMAHLRALADRSDVHIGYVCDVDRQRLAAAVQEATAKDRPAVKAVSDMRRLLDDPAVDAVFIATPDHWHVPAALIALEAGKHVYVEKPCSHNVCEGRMLVDAVRRTGKTLQIGTQSRSAPFLKQAIGLLRKGEIGEVLVAKAWNCQRRRSIGKSVATDPPPHLDFARWLGPTPVRAYRPNLLHSTWRWWYDYGTGDIGNDGVHDIDVALWGLDVATHPTRVTCLGNKSFFDDDQQFPDTQYAICEYPLAGSPAGRTTQLIYEQRIWSPYNQQGYSNGVAFYGDKGLLLVGHVQGWKLYGPRNKLLAEATGRPRLLEHHSDFFDNIQSGMQETAANVEVGHRAATVCHLANIAARVGRVLNFDPIAESIADDPDAQALLARTYRDKHWATPSTIADPAS